MTTQTKPRTIEHIEGTVLLNQSGTPGLHTKFSKYLKVFMTDPSYSRARIGLTESIYKNAGSIGEVDTIGLIADAKKVNKDLATIAYAMWNGMPANAAGHDDKSKLEMFVFREGFGNRAVNLNGAEQNERDAYEAGKKMRECLAKLEGKEFRYHLN